MGIPGYTRWLRQRFGVAFHPVVPTKPLGLQCPHHNRLGFDHVHFDLAARLYMVSGRANDTAHLVRLLLRDLHRVVRWTSPRQSVTLAVDGVPPAAKLWTQRIRRFERKRATSSGASSRGIDTLGFTLGTLVMRQVGLALSFFAVQALQANDFAHTVFYVSGPEVVGEGEHKLHARVLSLLGSRPAESHLIIGNDADLIVQACAAAAVVEQRQAGLPRRSRLLPGVATAIGDGATSIDQLTLLLTCASCLATMSLATPAASTPERIEHQPHATADPWSQVPRAQPAAPAHV
jgi:5'-3' exonuclease